MDRDSLETTLRPLLEQLYPEDHDTVRGRLLDLAERYAETLDRPLAPPDEATSYLITYGGSLQRDGEAPLQTLRGFLRDHLGDTISDVHLLPIYPWTSDDGFAVVDHRQVDPELGTWADVEDLGTEHGLMFDFVANHVSSAGPWFQGWLAGETRYAGYFLDPGPDFDTEAVVRPRATPLFHDFPRPQGGQARAWTTFGNDQVDVSAASPAVLLDLTDVLLGYLARGATAIRLDAIGFLWKTSGTSCLHLPQTHAVVKVWRALVDELSPGTLLLTETNVPHAENISYFGTGDDEAHMVYQFALPPLVLHAFATADATTLAEWSEQIGPVSETATWFNFLASHDGIGMRPTEGLLPEDDRQLLVDRARAHGGRAPMVTRPDGTPAPYELNVSYLDMLADPGHTDDEEVARRALAAHSILLSLVGVPALYYHSLFGSSHDIAGMEASGIGRRINREILDADTLLAELRTSPRRRAIFDGLTHMLRTRRGQSAFSPFADQETMHLDPRVLALRRAGATAHEVLSVTNVSDRAVDLAGVRGTDVLTGEGCDGALTLPPFGFAWVRTSD